MRDETISPKGSHFQVRNEACRVSDEQKCETKVGIVSSHADYFSHNNPIFASNLKMVAIGKIFCF